MTDDHVHVHGPDCEREAMLIPLPAMPVLVVALTEKTIETGEAMIVGSLPSEKIPDVLRIVANAIERRNKARLS